MSCNHFVQFEVSKERGGLLLEGKLQDKFNEKLCIGGRSHWRNLASQFFIRRLNVGYHEVSSTAVMSGGVNRSIILFPLFLNCNRYLFLLSILSLRTCTCTCMLRYDANVKAHYYQ